MKNILCFLIAVISLYSMVHSSLLSTEVSHLNFKNYTTGFQVLEENTVKDTTITVYGNCGTCKKAIEKAVKAVDGVESASWDKKKKILSVQFDLAKTSLDLIEKAIIAIGYDTEHFRADDAVYEELHQCCKYERKPH
ncbi:MAG: heavy-metal-associated domain-containing protein [Ignavibacteria bacterium]